MHLVDVAKLILKIFMFCSSNSGYQYNLHIIISYLHNLPFVIMQRRFTAQQALSKIWNIDAALSEDDELEEREVSESSDVDAESEDNSSTTEDDDVDESIDISVSNSVYTAKDGTKWVKQKLVNECGRIAIQNIFTNVPGTKASVKRKVDDPISAWRTLFTDNILKKIQLFTIEKAKEIQPEKGFHLELIDIEKFIGICYLRGVFGLLDDNPFIHYGLKNMDIHL